MKNRRAVAYSCEQGEIRATDPGTDGDLDGATEVALLASR